MKSLTAKITAVLMALLLTLSLLPAVSIAAAENDDGTADALPLGDINADGETNVQDGVLMQRILANLETDEGYLSRADLNDDGEINVQDGVLMQRLLANLTGKDDKEDIWIATWGTAMLTAAAEQTPTKPALANNTVRQQIRVSIGGDQLRLVLSNEYGATDLVIEEIKISRIDNPASYNVRLDTEKALTVGGKSSFTIPAGKRVTTDVINYRFAPLEDLAITMKLGSVPSTLTCHTASRCSTWVVSGNHVSDNNYSGNQEMTAWYFITELDTLADPDGGAIVCLGDSLTDGASVTTNGFARYTDELARQLQADDELNNLSVINMGIGGTALYTYGGDIAGTRRANRDVLGVPGVKYCILYMGINDIGGARTDISQNIINEYKSIIERCHNNGIKIFGCTLTPMKGNDYYTDLHERIRLKVNEFVMSDDSGFDGYIDLSSAVASPSDPAQIDRKYVSVWNDYLHFNDSGYKFVGKTVYERLKEYIK